MAPKKARGSLTPRRACSLASSKHASIGLDTPRQSALRNAGGSIATRRPPPSRLPSVLLAPVNADSHGAPRFTIVNVKLGDDTECLDWLQHIRDIRVLPASGVGAISVHAPKGPVRLAPFLWLGDAAHARDVEGLRKHDITAIVNVAGRDFGHAMPSYPANWECLRIDLCSEFEAAYHQKMSLLGEHFQRIFVFMERCVRSGRNILVHCMTGMGRAPTVSVAFLMLQFQWTLPKAMRWVLSQRPCAIEDEPFQQELLALAKVNDLLRRDEEVTQLLEEMEGPAAQVWQLAAGSSGRGRIPDRKKILEVIRSLCPEEVDMSDMDSDLAALEDGRGGITWQRFKRWFMLGIMKAG